MQNAAENADVVNDQIFPILASAVKNRASDIHIKCQKPPILRIDGQLVELNTPPFSQAMMEHTVQLLCALAGLKQPGKQDCQLDFSFHMDGTGRFRCHLFRQQGNWAAVLRVISEKIPEPKNLRLPPVINQLIELERGIVLVSGATGMGKSTTVASLLSEMSKRRSIHIVTIEDPVEFIIPSGRSTISQRSVGVDVESFDEALEASFREDLDVLFIGELRSRRAVEVALQAGESGHLCVSTIHTADVATTVSRISNLLPEEMRKTVLGRLADVLKVVISQRLVPLTGRAGRILVAEVMVTSPSLKEAIRDPQKHKTIAALIARESTGSNNQTFDQQLINLVRNKLISVQTAEAAATSQADLQRALRMG